MIFTKRCGCPRFSRFSRKGVDVLGFFPFRKGVDVLGFRKGVDVLGFFRFCPDNDAQQGTGAEEVKRQADMEY